MKGEEYNIYVYTSRLQTASEVLRESWQQVIRKLWSLFVAAWVIEAQKKTRFTTCHKKDTSLMVKA